MGIGMSNGPQYVAVLRDCVTKKEVDQLGTLRATADSDAIGLAKGLALKWLADNGDDCVVLHVVKDGATITTEEVRR